MKLKITALTASVLITLALSACSQQAQMPIASSSPSASLPIQSAAPEKSSALAEPQLPADKAQKEPAVLLATATLQPGITVRAYRVGTGEVISQQLASNPNLKAHGVKAGKKVAVIRYTVKNTSGKTVDVLSFMYGGIFVRGSGKAADTDAGYASSAVRLGFQPTPLAQFTDKKGKAGNWALRSGQQASWTTDWMLEGEGVLVQNFSLGKKVVSNIHINLLK